MRFRCAIALLAAGLAVEASAEPAARVWILEEPARASPVGIAGAITRDLGDFRLLILGPGAEAKAPVGAHAVDVRDGESLYLVDLAHARAMPRLETLGRLIHTGHEFALVSVPDSEIPRFDISGVCKERLAWLPRHRRRPSQDSPATLRKANPQVKAAIAGAVDLFRFSQIVQELSGDLTFSLNGGTHRTDNRYTFTAGSGSDIDTAADYLVDRLQTAGYPVVRQPFTVGGVTTENIIAIKTGTVHPDSVVVVGAHYDSISENAMILAPGAEDNATGVAAVVHLAEIFSAYQTERTVHFVCFGGEEQGLRGSQFYVGQLSANGWNVTQSLIMDMISSWQSSYKVIIEGEPAWAGLMAVFESNVIDHAGIDYRKDWRSFGSDHVPFQNAGIPCFLAIDWDYETYVHYHRSTDDWAWVDPTLGVKITQAIGTTLADLALPSPVAAAPPPSPAPGSLELGQNLPNPFNPSTRIDYVLPSAGMARLEIYDIAGRRIRSLVDGQQDAGPQTVVWDGRNSAGKRVASGVYIYRISHADATLSRRMILSK